MGPTLFSGVLYHDIGINDDVTDVALLSALLQLKDPSTLFTCNPKKN